MLGILISGQKPDEEKTMTKAKQIEAITKADLEIKAQHAALLKAQAAHATALARRENAEAARIEAEIKAK